MQVYVKVQDNWICVPCAEGKAKVSWLLSAALVRVKELGLNCGPGQKLVLTSSTSRIIYSNNDVICDVLNDKQFVEAKTIEQVTSDISSTVDQNLVSGFKKLSVPELNICKTVLLDGFSLTTEMLWQLANFDHKIEVCSNAERRVKNARKLLDDIVEQNKVVYGVSTGFGKFATTVIAPADLHQLQVNLIESHCAGVGDPLSPERTRMMLALRINIFCKGYSGISPTNLRSMVKAFNECCLPWIPEKGTVGASGDLAPLSHLALGLMGKGKMWSPKSGWADANHVLEANDIPPLKLSSKEGLALINGTQFMSALGAEAVERAKRIALQADVVASLTLEALQGTSRAFDAVIHEARPHKGQQAVAKRIRALLNYGGDQSEITKNHKNCNRVQDAYTLRCCPQVHGVAHDTIEFVKGILDVELNSATDNPMILVDRCETISGGNFHGEYPAKSLDYLAIGVHELAAMSERRIERMCNPAYNDLPAFLVENGGLNSGYMIPHCTAAALVSENKCLCHPSSVDSLSTSAGQEDHVSMGGWSARKALKVVENVEYVIAIELLCACQGIDFRRPLKTTETLEKVHQLVRSVVPTYNKDRVHSGDIETVVKLLQKNRVWEAVKLDVCNPPISADEISYSRSPTSSELFCPNNR